MTFSIERQNRDCRYRLLLRGELDLASAPDVESTLTELCEAGALEIEIDLRAVTFIDSAGLHAILRAKELCRDHRADFFVVRGEAFSQRRLFDLTGLTERIPWRKPQDAAAVSESPAAVEQPHGSAAAKASAL
ncbi:MAG TPA: STAS domain-containing protein [Solirubrobacteraceae bacterium]